MSLYLLLLLRRSSATLTINNHPLIRALHHLSLSPLVHTPNLSPPISTSPLLPPSRTFAFSSAEEAAADRRKRRRRLRIDPPFQAMQSNPPPPDPNAPRLPDSTNALTGHRLNLHNRVQSLIRAYDLDTASLVARNSVYSRTRPTVFTCNAIIAAMYRAKRYDDAVSLFKFFFEKHNIVPNVVSYNNLINAHCDEGKVDLGLEIYRRIIETALFSPSSVTYRHLTKGLIDAGRIEDAVALLREMLAKGHGADSLVYNNVIKGFLELGNLEKANEFFDELKERCLVYDGVINATFMDWWFKQGKDKEAMGSYKSWQDKNFKVVPATCNTILEVLVRYGKKEAACALFEHMLDNHTPPTQQAVNSDTFNIMVNECFKEAGFEEAIHTFKKAGTKSGSKPFQMDVAGYNNIIARFCENGMMEHAEEFFAALLAKCLTPDVVTFRTLIDAYLKREEIDDVLRTLNKMADAGLRVVASFGTRVFGELIKNGKEVESAEILTKMGNKDPKPDSSIYDVVVRGLCSAGELDASKDMLDQMIKYGVGIPPALKEFLIEVFGNAGRASEIKSVLDESKWINISRPAYARQPRSQHETAQMASGQPLGPSPMMGRSVSSEPQIARPQSFGVHPMSRQTELGSPQMTGQLSLGSHNKQQPSEFLHMDQQHPLRPYQGQQSSWSSQHEPAQMASGQPLGPSPMTRRSVSSEPQIARSESFCVHPMSGQTQLGSPQMIGRQSLGSHNRQQPSEFHNMDQKHPSGFHNMDQQHPLRPYQGQQSSWSSQHEPAQMASGQPLGPSPMTGRSVSSEPQIARSQSFGVHPLSGQTQLGSPQMTGQPSIGSHNRQQPSEFLNMDQKHPLGLHNMDPPMTGRSVSSESQIARSQSFGVHPMSRQAHLGSPQMTGQPSLGSHNREQPSEFHNMDQIHPSGLHDMDWQPPLRPYQGQQSTWSSQTIGQHPSRSFQAAGQHPSQSSQAAGQHPSWSSQTGQHPLWSSKTGQHPSWSSHTGEQQPSWSSQTGGQQQSQSSQSRGQQASWSFQAAGQHLSRSSQAAGQHLSRSSQAAGQHPSWSSQTGQHPSWSSHTGEQQASWSSQSRVQQASWSSNMEQQPSGTSHVIESHPNESPEMSGQVPFESSKNGGQYSYGSPAVVRHHPAGSSQIVGQHEWQDNQQLPNGPPDMAEEYSSAALEWQHSHRQAAA
ncbi:pentatricopeptide repeat-containing protein At1g10270 isoform X9 [Populus trichocarpa]|uniref:pentatricopeptide repeat-containing protein At1g10270 isoform X9 n=1 Tax=Populus trichocarpa TaxID=3694 RepID=UPI002278DD96|nr:pentatricopeptide repeat-containing protein At1g10270 isoform X9 [Populus trichocarpa]